LQSFIKNKRLAGKAVSAAASVAISVAAAAAVATISKMPKIGVNWFKIFLKCKQLSK